MPIVLRTLFLLTLLFVSAGTMQWYGAWLAFSLFVCFCLFLWRWLKKHDPALLRARMVAESQAGRPRFDRLFSWIYKATFLAWLIGMGLDYRWKLSQIPAPISILGALVMIVAFVLLFTVFSANAFLIREIRHQPESGHRVVQSGPYRFVRHPMYTAIGMMFFGASLLMGSWLGLFLAFLLLIELAIRSVYEEKTLVDSLPDYDTYRKRVRFRLVPYVW